MIRRPLSFLLALTLLLGACAQAAPRGTTDTTTRKPTPTTTAPAWRAVYTTDQQVAAFETTVLQSADIEPVSHAVTTSAGSFTVSFLADYSDEEQEALVGLVEAALTYLPGELLIQISPMTFYIHEDNSSCLHNDYTRVAGCTAGGGAILMIADASWNDRSFQETVLHEIGHVLDRVRQWEADFADFWLNDDCSAPGEHASTEPGEDVAESFMLYAMHRPALTAYSFERFAFFEERLGQMGWPKISHDLEQEEDRLRNLEIKRWNCQR